MYPNSHKFIGEENVPLTRLYGRKRWFFFPAILLCSLAQALYIGMAKDRLKKACTFNVNSVLHRKGNEDQQSG